VLSVVDRRKSCIFLTLMGKLPLLVLLGRISTFPSVFLKAKNLEEKSTVRKEYVSDLYSLLPQY